MKRRPECIRHYTELEETRPGRYAGSDEWLSIGSPLARGLGLTRLGIHHERLPPGRRTSYPHAESHEEEFVYVLEGNPQVWIDGEVHDLRPGDAVAFPAGTGVSHTFLNNTRTEVRLLVVGEASKKENKCFYPLNPERRGALGERFWDDAPRRTLGAHDGRARIEE